MPGRNNPQTPPTFDATVVGIDVSHLPLFQVYGENDQGRVSVQSHFSREELTAYFGKLSPCVVGIAFDEACASTARFWKKKLEALKHTVILMAMDFVRTHGHVQGAVDAKAICKAVKRTV
jgi:transposase